MIQDDPLEGFRAPLAGLARHVEKAAPDDALWQRLYLGDAASKIMRGVAARVDIAKVLAMMIAQCEVEVQVACNTILDATDLTDPVARKAHFDARVSAAILGRINQYVRDGTRAGEEINNKGDLT
jgi:hypothetical protein